jgi:hypothetical protein
VFHMVENHRTIWTCLNHRSGRPLSVNDLGTARR